MLMQWKCNLSTFDLVSSSLLPAVAVAVAMTQFRLSVARFDQPLM